MADSLVEQEKLDAGLHSPGGISWQIWRIYALVERGLKLKEQKLANGLSSQPESDLIVLSVAIGLGLTFDASVQISRSFKSIFHSPLADDTEVRGPLHAI